MTLTLLIGDSITTDDVKLCFHNQLKMKKSWLSATEIDWWMVPEDQKILSNEILDWITPEAKQIFKEDYFQEMANEENIFPPSKHPKKTEQYSNVDVTSSISLTKFSKGFVPFNTKSNTDWAVKSFLNWAELQKADDPVPKDFFTLSDSVAINKWLSLFIIEVRKKDGSRFPNSSLTLLLCGIKRYMKGLNPNVPNFLNEEDSRFIGLRGTRDTISRNLRTEGVGASVKHTAIITQDEEDNLWTAGVLGVDNPTALLNTVFYMNGKMLCLRRGTEHKLLKINQFSFGSGDCVERVTYTENGSKNRSGSYKDSADDKKLSSNIPIHR